MLRWFKGYFAISYFPLVNIIEIMFSVFLNLLFTVFILSIYFISTYNITLNVFLKYCYWKWEILKIGLRVCLISSWCTNKVKYFILFLCVIFNSDYCYLRKSYVKNFFNNRFKIEHLTIIFSKTVKYCYYTPETNIQHNKYKKKNLW